VPVRASLRATQPRTFREPKPNVYFASSAGKRIVRDPKSFVRLPNLFRFCAGRLADQDVQRRALEPALDNSRIAQVRQGLIPVTGAWSVFSHASRQQPGNSVSWRKSFIVVGEAS